MIFLLCKLVSKLVIIVTNNFWLLKLVTNEAFSYSDYSIRFLFKEQIVYKHNNNLIETPKAKPQPQPQPQ